MQFKGRALYNFLQISSKEDPSLKPELWQVLDYRALSDKEIYDKMAKLGLVLSEESLMLYAENCDSPEELLECLWIDETKETGEEALYLLLFEFWRRKLPEKQSLSIFCDELDYLISLYDLGEECQDSLEKTLEELEDILDQSVDAGEKAQEVFASLMSYMAHDLERFLYDYILDMLDESNEVYASELIDAMLPYVKERKWFEFLKARLFSMSNSPETGFLIARLLEQAEEEPDLSFLMEICLFLVHRGDFSLFSQCMKQMLPLMKTEGDFLECMQLISDFYESLDEESIVKKVNSYLEKRKKPEDHPVQPEDKKIIEDLLLK